jgi:hypothetical protein
LVFRNFGSMRFTIFVFSCFKWHLLFRGRVVSRNWISLRTIFWIMPLFVTNEKSDSWWISRFERTRFPYLVLEN